MWIRLLKKVDEHAVGAMLEVEDAVARGYIAAGMAEDGGTGPEQAIASKVLETFRAEMSGFAESLNETVRAANAAMKRPSLTATEAEADKRRSLGDMIRNIVSAADGRHPEAQRKAHETLEKVYGHNPAERNARAMTEGTGTSFGYTTSTVYETQMMEVAAQEAVITKGCMNVPLAAAQVEYPALDQYRVPSPGQSAMFGGIQTFRRGELVQRTESDAKATKIIMQAQDLTAYTELSRNLIQDSNVSVDSYITGLMGRAIGWREDWEAMLGSGEGQFVGYLKAACTILVNRKNTTGAKALDYTDCTKMLIQLMPMSRRRAKWIIHPFKVRELYELTDASGRLIYVPNFPNATEGPAAAAPPSRLLGLPVEITEFAPAPGQPGDLSLIDPMCYLKGTRSGVEIGLSEHFKFDTDVIAIRAKVRNDGKPWLKKAITLADGAGSNLVSGFIALN